MAQHNDSLICWAHSSSLVQLESEGLAQGRGSCIEQRTFTLLGSYSYKPVVAV